ncbi:adenylyl cyclase-associated protein 1 isoform X2 [Haematobia irritans]|uniref:adenylyl cyclase-associated protein 1 isoform X2 n=1 Tax=Haematobia irritans TaxID=7368 RepID=UPI003F501758
MFSCCRANPKKSKKSNEITGDNQTDEDIKNNTTSNENKNLIIPTITIENGKTTTDDLKATTNSIANTDINNDKVNGNDIANDKNTQDDNGVNSKVEEASPKIVSSNIKEEGPSLPIEAISHTIKDDINDCDPALKPSVAENLEILINRLEKLVERLERSISARELDIANRTFDTVLEQKRASVELSPPAAGIVENLSVNEQTEKLNQRIERIEESLGRINERHSQGQSSEGSFENIPTVIDDFSSLPPPPPPLELSMSVLGYQDIVNGSLAQYLALSSKIGGDVAKHAEFVKKAFDAQLAYVTLATQCSQPDQSKQMELLKPTSDQITAIQDFREKNRASPFFNHLSAISESIPALGWVCVSPTPGPHVKEMNDAGQFYTNRVLKEWKEKDATHVEWARAWVQTLTELQQFIKQYHTTGLVWSGKGSAPAGGAVPPPPPMGACPPPPPPPTFDLANMGLDGGDERSALFAEINQGENITRNLKKVTADMQTHKNPTLRTGPAPFKTPTQFGSVSKAPAVAVAKPPVFTRDGKKWIIEYQKNNPNLIVENAEMNNVVYVFKCEGSTLTVKGKVNNVVFDSCKKCSLLFDSVVASVEFVNCQSVQMQVLGNVPTISIDKTDGCQMYLSKDSMGVEIVSSKSSEMNVMLPADDNGDYTELPLPEQFKTTISGKTLKTVCVDSLG